MDSGLLWIRQLASFDRCGGASDRRILFAAVSKCRRKIALLKVICRSGNSAQIARKCDCFAARLNDKCASATELSDK